MLKWQRLPHDKTSREIRFEAIVCMARGSGGRTGVIYGLKRFYRGVI